MITFKLVNQQTVSSWQHWCLAREWLFSRYRCRFSIALLACSGIAATSTAQCLPDEIQKVTASDARRGELYGISVQILGDLAISGAAWAHVENHRAGAVYAYRKDPITNQWIQEQKLFP